MTKEQQLGVVGYKGAAPPGPGAYNSLSPSPRPSPTLTPTRTPTPTPTPTRTLTLTLNLTRRVQQRAHRLRHLAQEITAVLRLGPRPLGQAAAGRCAAVCR